MADNPFSPWLLIESRGAVRIVTMNRPEALNAVNEGIHHGLANVWRHVAADPEARAVVITGAGRAFSAGGDMAMFRRIQQDPVERAAQLEQARSVFNNLIDCSLPVVAAVNGPAVGLGCTMAVLCDLVYVAETAFLSDPHVAIGLTAGDGGAPFWPLTMSLVKAKELLFFGDRVSAQDAVAIGLANEVVAADELLSRAVEVAERLAALPPQAVQSTKRAVNLHVRAAANAILDYALAAEHLSYDTEEHKAAVDQFFGARGHS
jgi:enoyl-CoA hydratase/carnithine racemase